jgi:hypothetical protein
MVDTQKTRNSFEKKILASFDESLIIHFWAHLVLAQSVLYKTNKKKLLKMGIVAAEPREGLFIIEKHHLIIIIF